MPVYNGARLLGETLIALRNQIFQDFEINPFSSVLQLVDWVVQRRFSCACFKRHF